jgi:hypothetical protein
MLSQRRTRGIVHQDYAQGDAILAGQVAKQVDHEVERVEHDNDDVDFG